jgi:hypothetical protein
LVIGYRSSYTQPIPFLVEVLVLPIWLLLFLIDLFISRPVTFGDIKIHVWGAGSKWLDHGNCNNQFIAKSIKQAVLQWPRLPATLWFAKAPSLNYLRPYKSTKPYGTD